MPIAEQERDGCKWVSGGCSQWGWGQSIVRRMGGTSCGQWTGPRTMHLVLEVGGVTEEMALLNTRMREASKRCEQRYFGDIWWKATAAQNLY